MKAFIAFKFGYCPLVWMFHSRKLNSLVNKLHEREIWEFGKLCQTTSMQVMQKVITTSWFFITFYAVYFIIFKSYSYLSILNWFCLLL